MNTRLLLAWLAVAAFLPLPARADDGHDHDAAPAAPAGPALPRFAAVSELFELVGLVDGQRLTVYLDRFEDNTPVQGAKLELELGGVKVALEEHEAGEFEGILAQTLKPGVIAVTATVAAGNETDILAGELDIHGEQAEAVHAHGWREYAGWGGGAAAAAVLLGWGLRRWVAARRTRAGGAA